VSFIPGMIIMQVAALYRTGINGYKSTYNGLCLFSNLCCSTNLNEDKGVRLFWTIL